MTVEVVPSNSAWDEVRRPTLRPGETVARIRRRDGRPAAVREHAPDSRGRVPDGLGGLLSGTAARTSRRCGRLLDGRAAGDRSRVPPLRAGDRLQDLL